ncbi:MAG: helix-turn-helix domain-containing protein [bacterium]|nr:helix-turn-helix domain-containing protein [bacterium]
MLLIGAKIQEYRKRAGLSQEEFAAKIGVTRQAVSKWELDKTYPDLDKLAGICDIFGISITEFLYGKTVSAPGEEPMEIRMISAGKARGKGARLRLSVLFVLLGGLCLFCGVMLVTTLMHHAWKKDDGLIERARVERVYQQYTKADICFYDDVSRKVVKTVWLDIDGIRDGDFIECYTDEAQRGAYYEYRARTLIALAAVTGVLFVLFLLCALELRRLAKENRWHIRVDGTEERDGEPEETQVEEQTREQS